MTEATKAMYARAISLIYETVEAYRKPDSRAVFRQGCAYDTRRLADKLGDKIPEKSCKCAVGRCMTEDALDAFYNERSTFDVGVHGLAEASPDDKNSIDYVLLPKYHGFHVQFWYLLQGLHDNTFNWATLTDEFGQRRQMLSSTGQRAVASMLAALPELLRVDLVSWGEAQ